MLSDTKKNPMDGTSPFLCNPTSSDTSNWRVLSWNPVSSPTTNSDHFLIPDGPESLRMPTDPKIGSDRFRLHRSDRNSVNPISGYQRKTVDIIGIWWKVTDRIRWSHGTGFQTRPTGSDAPRLTWVLSVDLMLNW